MKRWLLRFQRRQYAPLFQLGELTVTVAARHVLTRAALPLGELLERHQRGDWGQVDEVDRRQNELGVRLGLRIRSSYAVDASGSPRSNQGVLAPTTTLLETVWLVTSPDRLRTTVFLPREIFDDNTPHP